MNKPYAPKLNPDIVRRITERINALDLPGEALLVEACADLIAQVEADRSALQLNMEQTRHEGVMALSRILLSAEDVQRQPGDDYLNRS
jgi:hypothetical protein